MPVRDVALLLPDEPLCCPRGHRVPKNAWAIGAEAMVGYRCQFRTPPGHTACGAVVVLVTLDAQLRIVVDVTSGELYEMERRCMTLREIRNFLGLAWRPAA